MSRDQKPFSHLEALPRDLISQILSEVAKANREDVTNCILTCNELAKSADDHMVFRNIELNDLVKSPLLAANNYTELMAKCIEHSNPSAHYVKGILEYFRNDHPTEGLTHLYIAANATKPIPEAVYLYGIINLCLGQFELGRNYIDQLRTGSNTSKADACWKNIKRSLHGIGIVWKPIYSDSHWEMVPPFECDFFDLQMFLFQTNAQVYPHHLTRSTPVQSFKLFHRHTFLTFTFSTSTIVSTSYLIK